MNVNPAITAGISPRLRRFLASQKVNLHNLSALIVFNFLAAGLFFVTQVRIANVIGKEQFGLLAYGIALGMYGQTIVRYGMDRTLVRDLMHYPERFSELVMASLLLRGVLLGLVVGALVAWKLVWRPMDMTWPVIVIVLAYSLKSLDLQPVYDAWHRMARHAAYNMVQRGLYFALIWILVFWAPSYLTLSWISIALLTTEVFYLLLQQRWAFQRIDLRETRIQLGDVILELSRGNCLIWLAAMGALSFGALNQIMLKHYCGAAQLGGYAAGWQIASVATLLLHQVGRIGNPATACSTRTEMNRRSRIRFLLRYAGVMLLTAAPICIPLLFVPELVVETVFSPEYASSAGTLRVFSAYVLILSLGIVASQYVISARMERNYFASVVVGGLVSLMLCVTLIPRLGGLGAALALLMSHGTSMTLYSVAMIQHLRKQR